MFLKHWLLLAALTLMCFAAACSGGDDDGGTVPPPGGGSTLNPEERVPEVQVQIVDHQFRRAGLSDEPLNLDPIPGLIASARTSLDIALPRLNRQEIVTQLLAAANRGVLVRIVTERGYFEDPAYVPFYAQLQDPARNAGNITIQTDDDGFPRLMQSRFMVIDQTRVVTGSYTWESADFDRTFGDVVSIFNTNVATAFTSQFNQMFTEGRFGVQKRDDTQHTFAVGNNQGLLEVYFGPTDLPRDQITSYMQSSSNVHIAAQQFTDITFASDLFNWLGSSEERRLFLFVNNAGSLGDEDDNAVFGAWQQYAVNPPDGGGEAVVGSFGLGNLGIPDDFIPNYDTADYGALNSMNHKLMFFDDNPALLAGIPRDGDTLPGVVSMTANFTDLGLSQNDMVMLVFRGDTMVNKYIRGPRIEPFAAQGGTVNVERWGLDLLPGSVEGETTRLPGELRSFQDIQEFEALLAMFPHISSTTNLGNNHREFAFLPTGIIFGTIPNFERQVQIPSDSQDGEFEEALIDISFEVFGRLTTGETFALDNLLEDGSRDPDITPAPVPLAANFDTSSTRNPGKRFIAVVPAGTITLRSIVTDSDGAADPRFQTSDRQITIGPGAVRQVNLNVNLSPQRQDTGGGGAL